MGCETAAGGVKDVPYNSDFQGLNYWYGLIMCPFYKGNRAYEQGQ